MTYVDAVNLFELIWWPTIGVLIAARCRRAEHPWRRLGYWTAFWLILFGISDGIELYTKAWWNPWWLLVLKAACLIGLAGCGVARILVGRVSRPVHSSDLKGDRPALKEE